MAGPGKLGRKVKTVEMYESESVRSPKGCLIHPNKTSGTARHVYILRYGSIPRKLEVCHHCDVPRCIADEHLFLGTHADNMHDAVMKGRTRHLEEMRHKFSRVKSQEERDKISLRARNRSPEVRLKHSLALLGRKRSKEQIEKTAAANRGKRRSLEVRRKMSEALLMAWKRRRAVETRTEVPGGQRSAP